jgi:stress response protein YsnF
LCYAKTADVSQETDTRVPLIEERLNVSKQESAQQATVIKEPVTETKTVEVPLTHEEVTIERRPASGTTTTTAERPVESKTEMKILLKKYKLQRNLT